MFLFTQKIKLAKSFRKFCFPRLQKIINLLPLSKAELRQSFSTCVYCMQLHFQSNYIGFEPTNVISLKMQLHALNACVKRSSQRSLNAVLRKKQNKVANQIQKIDTILKMEIFNHKINGFNDFKLIFGCSKISHCNVQFPRLNSWRPFDHFHLVYIRPLIDL